MDVLDRPTFRLLGLEDPVAMGLILFALSAALIVWLGRRRGMRSWNWLGGFLAIEAVYLVVLLLGANLILSIGLGIISLGYIVVFLLWPWLVEPGHRAELAKQAQVFQAEEQAADEARHEALTDWVTVKFYTDGGQAYEMRKDKEILEANAIPSFVKSVGITTLCVHQQHAERACALLGIEAISEDDAG